MRGSNLTSGLGAFFSWPGAPRRASLAMVLLAFVGVYLAAAEPARAGSPTGGSAVAWGENKAYQLGAGYRNQFEDAPVTVREPSHVEMSEVVAISSSYHFSLALLGSGEVKSWGGNDVFSQLGAETPVGQEQIAPVTVMGPTGKAPLEEVKAISAGGSHAAALEKNGTVMAWGSNVYGELGNGVLNPERIWYTKTGEEIKEDTMLGTAANHAEQVKGLGEEAIAIAVGGHSDYALMKGGTVMAWGSNQAGALGIGEMHGKGESHHVPEDCKGGEGGEGSCSTKPLRVCAVGHSGTCPSGPYLEGVVAIAAGEKAADAVLKTGEVVAWGEDAEGQLGDPSLELQNSDVPVKVSLGSGQKAVSVAAGKNFALALLESGEVVGWGSNKWGQVGEKTKKSECSKDECDLTPTLIKGLAQIKAISAGAVQSFALTTAGTLYALGYNFPDGELGVGVDPSPELELCGEVKIKEYKDEKERKAKEREEEEVKCATKPTLVRSGVSAISAGENLNTAILEAGVSGPASPVSLTPEVDALKLEWMVPGPKYYISYRGESAEIEKNEAKREELLELEEVLLQQEKEAHEEGNKEAEEKYLKEAKAVATERAEVATKIKEEEGKNKWAKQVTIEGTEKCSFMEHCHYLVEGLTAGEPYEVRLKKEETSEEEGGTIFVPGTPLAP
jgi:alpha-tubulin suppressor-like RCC1 family protein